MLFQPTDEMSLRQLFSTDYAKGILNFEYLGRVINTGDKYGGYETSPDALILDTRESPNQVLRCEFKCHVDNWSRFKNNGQFDIAIIWSLAYWIYRSNYQMDKFCRHMREEHSCREIIILKEIKEFSGLPKYNLTAINNLKEASIVRELSLNQTPPSVYALYIAAKIYPMCFDLDKMVELLINLLPEMKRKKPRGQASIATAFCQTKPSLIQPRGKKSYQWSNDVANAAAIPIIESVIVVNFGMQLPSESDIASVTMPGLSSVFLDLFNSPLNTNDSLSR